MRRFSQRNGLVTLNEINITPLLDLAFVLLIIFVITRPLLEQNVDLQLPNGGAADNRRLNRSDIRIIEVKPNGEYFVGGKRLSLRQLESDLLQTFRQNPKLVVDIRCDKRTEWNYMAAVMDLCVRNHITRFTYHTAPLDHK